MDEFTAKEYVVEGKHLNWLRTMMLRLYTEQRMHGDEMRDNAHRLLYILENAEPLEEL